MLKCFLFALVALSATAQITNHSTLLRYLEMVPGRLSPQFLPTTFYYNSTVPAILSNTTLYLAALDTSASVLVNGFFVPSFNASVMVVLNPPGQFTVCNIMVIVGNNSSSTYSLVIYRQGEQPSGGPRLNSLEIHPGILQPQFNSSRFLYIMNVSSSTQFVNVSARPAVRGEIIVIQNQVTDHTAVQLPPAGQTLPLIVSVYSLDNSSRIDYTVYIQRAPASDTDPTLSYLSAVGFDLEPAFAPTVFNYSVQADSTDSSIYITCLPTNAASIVHINGYTTTSLLVNLTATLTNVVIAVASADITRINRYFIAIKRPAADDDATLQRVFMTPGAIVPRFESDVLDYSLVINSNVTSVNVEVAPSNPKASVTINGFNGLSGKFEVKVGSIIEIAVKSVDGKGHNTYTFTLTDASGDTSLRFLHAGPGQFAPLFDPAVFIYDLSVPQLANFFNVSCVATNPNAIVLINQVPANQAQIFINRTSVLVTIYVLASDGPSGSRYLINAHHGNQTAATMIAPLVDVTAAVVYSDAT